MTTILFILCFILGFFVPGYLVSKLLKSPFIIASSFIISTVILFELIFLLEIIKIRISFMSVFICLISISAVLFLLVHLRKVKDIPEKAVGYTPDKKYLILLIPVIATALLILTRGILQPFTFFNGDQIFRWNFIAFRMMELGNFSFFPPLTQEDFNYYYYIDGIPLAVPFSYFWIYASYGGCLKNLTGLHIFIQYVLLLLLTYRTANIYHGDKESGLPAAGILATSMLFFYSVIIGEETGFIAISAVATFYFIVAGRSGDDVSAAILSGFATSLGVLSREYGWAFILIGFVAFIWRKAGIRVLIIYSIVVFSLSFPWYLRNWILAGNPFYSNPVGNIFNVHPFMEALLETMRSNLGLSVFPSLRLQHFSIIVLYTALIPVLFGLISFIFNFRRMLDLMVISLALILLWAYSVGNTAGGIFQSMRVLSPVIVFLSIAGASLFLGPLSGRRMKASIYLVFLCGCIAFFQDLTAPRNIFKEKSSEWLKIGFENNSEEPEDISIIRGLPQGTRILSDDQVLFAKIAELGIKNVQLVPYWSPEVSFLYDECITSEGAIRKLRKIGIGYILIQEPLSLNYKYICVSRFKFFSEYKSFSTPAGGSLLKFPDL